MTARHPSRQCGDLCGFRSRRSTAFAMLPSAPWWWWKARPSDPYLTERTAMIIFGPLLVIVGIGFFCWLLFTLAVFALPFFAGITAGAWAYDTGAGWLGAILVGVVAAGLTLGIGQVLLGIVRPLWARMLIALAFVAPAAIAGYFATHGIVQHTMPSDTWQMVFSVIGAIAVGVTAFAKLTGMASGSPEQVPAHG